RAAVAEIEEGNAGTVRHAEEDVHIGTVFSGRRHDVVADVMEQRQAEDVFIEMARFLGIAAAIGEMMQAMDRNGFRKRSGLPDSGFSQLVHRRLPPLSKHRGSRACASAF